MDSSFRRGLFTWPTLTEPSAKLLPPDYNHFAHASHLDRQHSQQRATPDHTAHTHYLRFVYQPPKITMSTRTGGRQSMSELKLRRLIEHNQRLREDLARPRVRVSEASASLIRYCKTTKDHLVPSVWGPVGRAEDPYGQQATGKCCSIQ